MKKRGQVALFIVIGMVLLILGSLISYWVYSVNVVDKRIIPDDIKPVTNYVDLCVELTSKEAIERMGVQGGYIEIPDSIRNNPYSYIEVLPGSPFLLPMWYYKGNSRLPTKLDEQISDYVEENLKGCLRGFRGLEQEFEITDTDELRAETVIGRDDVLVTLEYPLEITSKAQGTTTKYSKYLAKLDVSLKDVFDLAKAIMKAENEQMFFEDLVINLMVLQPEIPFSDMSFSCGRKTWLEHHVRTTLSELITANMPRVRVAGTDHEPFALPLSEYSEYDRFDDIAGEDIGETELPNIDELPPDMYEYKQMYWELGGKKYEDLEVNFIFDSPIKMRVRPSDNGIMRSNMGRAGDFIRFMCINVWHFTYDVEFPITVSVRDPDAFAGEGYNFNFAFPVYINHNQGDRTNFGIMDYIEKDYEPDFCEDTGDEQIKIYVKDPVREDIRYANITFECGRFSCPLGVTDLEAPGFKLSTYLPRNCVPGNIIAEKEGYLKAEKDIRRGDDRVIVDMTPMQKLDVKVLKHRSDNLEQGEELLIDEQAMISIINDDIDYYEFITYPNMTKQIELPVDEYTYDLEIYMMDTGDKTIVGGYTANFTTSRQELVGASEITFHVYEQIPTPITDREKAALFLNLQNADYRLMLRPTLR